MILKSLDTWSSAIKAKSSAGRGGGKKQEFYGIKKLRELILELAVRGLLVPQDAKDEPASELLKKVGIEKAKLIKNGKLKKKQHLPLEPTECRYNLPGSWQWVRFGEIALHNAGKTLDRGRNSGELCDYITTSNLYWGNFDLTDVRQMPIREEELEKCSATNGDLLICEGGEAGRAAVWTEERDICFQNHIHRARFYGGIDAFYAYRVFEKLSMSGEIENYRKGVGISNMSGKALSSIVFPIPPLAEQHRIVAKVDELMALCDQLEQQQEDSVRTHDALVQTLLGTLTAASERGQFTEAWQRIAAHFDTLFTTETSIAQLKQTILQLAVMGKLVEQNPEDERVEKMLARNDDRRREAAQDDRRASKEKQTLLSADLCWEVPQTWLWRGLADIVLFVDYRGKTPTKISSGVRLLTAKNVRRSMINLDPEEFISEEEYKRWMTRGFPKTGDVLFTTEAPMGNAAVIELVERVALAQRVICFQNYGALDSQFLVLQLLSNQFQSILDENGTGMTAKGIKATKLKRLPIAIPPLAEQRRIVAKVDEMMTLCDRLKARLQSAQTTQLHLAETLVEATIH